MVAHKITVYICFFLFFKVNCYFRTLDVQICYTPAQKLGKCVGIRNCPELYNLLQHKPLTTEQVNYLRQSQCGYEESQPKVCCPESTQPYIPDKGSSDLLPDTDTCGLHLYNLHQGKADASINEFPWLALLEYEKPIGHGFYCGGTLISKKYVLTAAHCVNRLPENSKLISVRLGENNLDNHIDCKPNVHQCADPPINISIESTIVHEHYDPDDRSQINDIALLRLSRSVTFTDFIRPICLPISIDILSDIHAGSKMLTAGWGLISEERSHSHVKLKTVVQLQSHENCSDVYNTIGVRMYDQLCVEEEECTTDSGGSVVINKKTPSGYNWFIAGVKSFGPTPCGYHNWPDVYTRVTKFVPWIINHLRH